MPLTRTTSLRSLATAVSALGAAVVQTELLARRAERRHPPVGRFLDADGVRLHYVDEGQGPPLVLLHGQGSLLQDFTLSILPELATRHRVIAFDRPGYGYSSRPQDRAWTARREANLLRKALRQLGVDRPVFVGHSWGAQVTMAYAILYPESISSAVLIAGFFYPVGRIGARLLGLAGRPVIGHLASRTVATPISRTIRAAKVRTLFAPSEVPPRYWRLPFDLKDRPISLRTELQELDLLEPSAAELVPWYPTVRTPLAILAGEGDRIVGWRGQSLRLHREVPFSTFKLLKNTGHMLHHTCPGEVLAAVAWAAAQHGP